jgi:hypothetical protein
MNNEKLKMDIQRVMQVFAQNEMGNKLTQFNLMGLTNMLMGVIDGTVVIQQQGQQPPQQAETHRVELPEADDDIDMPLPESEKK